MFIRCWHGWIELVPFDPFPWAEFVFWWVDWGRSLDVRVCNPYVLVYDPNSIALYVLLLLFLMLNSRHHGFYSVWGCIESRGGWCHCRHYNHVYVWYTVHYSGASAADLVFSLFTNIRGRGSWWCAQVLRYADF